MHWSAGAAAVNMSWRYGGMDVVSSKRLRRSIGKESMDHDIPVPSHAVSHALITHYRVIKKH